MGSSEGLRLSDGPSGFSISELKYKTPKTNPMMAQMDKTIITNLFFDILAS